jgi:hypothetical protein
MNLSSLQELKKKLVNDKDLLPVWEFFLDHLGDDPAFIDLGEPVDHAFLQEVLPRLGAQMYPRAAMICQMRLVRLADQQFIHGAVNVDGRAGGVLFFEDVQVGLLAVSDHFPSDETKCARFSAKPYKPEGKPSHN